MEHSPSDKEENSSDAARKKFVEAKLAMHDNHCYDVDSNKKLRKELNLRGRKYYGTLKAMREGREVGVSGRPSYLHETEKIAFWNWVREESLMNRCPTITEMMNYVNRIVKAKRPVLIHKRSTVSSRYIRNLLKEGHLNLDLNKNMYVVQYSLTAEKAIDFFQKLSALIHQFHISKDVIFNMDEIRIQPGDPSTRDTVTTDKAKTASATVPHYDQSALMIGCISASGQSLPRVYVISPQVWNDSIPQETFIPPSRIFQSKNGRFTDVCMREWILSLFLPWIQERRRLFGWKEALLIADAHGVRYNNEILNLLNNNGICVALVPPGAATLMQPLYAGVYSRYSQMMKMCLESSGIVETLSTSERIASDTFTITNIQDAWDRTTLLSEDHSSILQRLPKESVKGSVEESVEEVVSDTVNDTVNDTISDTAKDTVHNTVNDTVHNTVKETP